MQLLSILLLCAFIFIAAGSSLRKKRKAGQKIGNQQTLLVVFGVVTALARIGAWYAAEHR